MKKRTKKLLDSWVLAFVGAADILLADAVFASQAQTHSVAHPRQALHLTPWNLAGASVRPEKTAPRLELDPSQAVAEEIIVYGKRHPADDPAVTQAGLPPLGPVTFSGAAGALRPNFSGVRVTSAIPVPGVPGLDAVLDLSAGRDQVSASTTTNAAQATMGLRLKF